MCLGDGPPVLHCKGCVCGLSVFSIIFALIGLFLTGESEKYFLSFCHANTYYFAGSEYVKCSARVLVQLRAPRLREEASPRVPCKANSSPLVHRLPKLQPYLQQR